MSASEDMLRHQTRAAPAQRGRPRRAPDTASAESAGSTGSAAPAALDSSASGVLRMRGGRVIVMTEQAYILLLQVIHEHAPEILKYAFYDMGYRAGIEIMARLATRSRDPRHAFRAFVEQYAQAGYGELEVTHFDPQAPEARITGSNLFEAGLAPHTGIYRTPRTVDHYSRGMFAGFMSQVLRREVVCEEVACQFRGDPRCEFVVLPFQS